MTSAAQSSEKHSAFWQWFASVESQFPETASFDAEFGDELSSHLSNASEGLTYEIATPKVGLKEIVISADGIRDLIPEVQGLVNSAPKLANWKVTAFRPRMNDYTESTLKFADQTFNPQKMWFYSRMDEGNFDLILYHANYTEEDRNAIISASYILLDMALGEYDVMTGIRYIDHQAIPENPSEVGLRKFSELREVFDEAKKSIAE